MANIRAGDLVQLRGQIEWLGNVVDVVEGRPRWLLVQWQKPSNLAMNPVLESEDVLALARPGPGDLGGAE